MSKRQAATDVSASEFETLMEMIREQNELIERQRGDIEARDERIRRLTIRIEVLERDAARPYRGGRIWDAWGVYQ